MALYVNDEGVGSVPTPQATAVGKSILADLSLLGICVIWGTSFAIVKSVVRGFDPAAFIAARFIVATLLIGIVAGPRLRRLSLRTLAAGAVLAVPLFVGFLTQTLGLAATTASKAGFITGMHVAFTPFLAFVVLGKRVRVWAAIGVSMAVVGLGMLSLDGSVRPAQGDLLVLACAFAFAVHIVLLGKYSPQSDGVLLAFTQMAWVTVIACMFAGPDLRDLAGFGREAALSAVYLGATGTALAYLVQTVAQKYTPPTRAALIFQMEPVLAALFANLWLGEAMSARQFAGAGLILAGILVCQVGDLRFAREG
ncbi:MAG: DMT family transporter [Firmicutes bacterium]|nr:DMT family transporter [Bacillota bacterium]